MGLCTFELPQIGAYSQIASHFTADTDYEGTGSYVSYDNDRWTNFYNDVAQYKLMRHTFAGLDAAEQAKNQLYMDCATVWIYDELEKAIDLWGDVPFINACNIQISGNVADSKAVYDDAATLYQMMLNGATVTTVTDESVTYDGLGTLYSRIQSASAPAAFASQDMLFGGNKDAWARYALGLRARMALRISTQGKLTSLGQSTLSEISNALANFSDDCVTGFADPSIAAFHAIALNQKGQLLDKMFEINYDFPANEDGLDESENYTAECNLFSCLPQPAYHYALCQQVVEGPRLRFLKILVICSALQQEDALCKRYLAFLDKMPFQHDFVEIWEQRLESPQLTAEDPTMARILQQVSFEDGFENDYARPCYIGFNLGVRRATPETLKASMAAALYCKDLENVVFRATYLKQVEALPSYVQEAIVVASAKKPEIMQQFPEISDLMKNRVSSFANEASVYLGLEDTIKAYDALYEKWGNSFMYYYYFGNRNRTVQNGFVTAVN